MDNPGVVYLKRVSAVSGGVVMSKTDRKTLKFVGQGKLWLTDDAAAAGLSNDSSALDSRHFGPVPMNMVLGRASRIVWPPSRFGKINNPFDEDYE
jgi:mitochondrial inner membrane protease subunit 2